jgi:N-acetylglucosamine kinase-like BadF-type ATPase
VTRDLGSGTPVVVGLDVGGTKTAVRIETLAGERVLDTRILSVGWDAEPVVLGAAWIDAALRSVVPAELTVQGIGIGAQGLDSAHVAQEFEAALAALGWSARAVNDAALLVPAAGLDAGIGVISGTGAIGVGADASGELLVTGGWGWVIGDEGGAAGLVREAARRALSAHDDGAADDGLLGALLAAFEVGDAERLARAVNDEPTMDNWGPRAPAVFAAAAAGSALAGASVEAAGEHLAHLVTQLRRRGAAGDAVVASGSMIVNQPPLWAAFTRRVGDRHPELSLHLLTDEPVTGAVRLARSLVVVS